MTKTCVQGCINAHKDAAMLEVGLCASNNGCISSEAAAVMARGVMKMPVSASKWQETLARIRGVTGI